MVDRTLTCRDVLCAIGVPLVSAFLCFSCYAFNEVECSQVEFRCSKCGAMYRGNGFKRQHQARTADNPDGLSLSIRIPYRPTDKSEGCFHLWRRKQEAKPIQRQQEILCVSNASLSTVIVRCLADVDPEEGILVPQYVNDMPLSGYIASGDETYFDLSGIHIEHALLIVYTIGDAIGGGVFQTEMRASIPLVVIKKHGVDAELSLQITNELLGDKECETKDSDNQQRRRDLEPPE